MRPRTRDDLITWSTAEAPGSPGMPAGAWSEFLRAAVPEDALDWLQVLAGYAATGHTREHLLLFIYGPAATGKGTWLSALADSLGSYARRIDPTDLMESRSTQHPAWLADLAGRRLVIGDEIPRGSKWHTGRAKSLVSGETIRARKMRQDYAEFRPQAQIVLAANHAPSLGGAKDTGLSRRLRVLPFTHRPAVLDPTLGARIDKREVMRWIVDGAQRYLDEGLPAALESVRRATADYESEADMLSEFVSVIAGTRVAKTMIYQTYATWAGTAGVKVRADAQGALSDAAGGLQRSGRHDGQRGPIGDPAAVTGISTPSGGAARGGRGGRGGVFGLRSRARGRRGEGTMETTTTKGGAGWIDYSRDGRRARVRLADIVHYWEDNRGDAVAQLSGSPDECVYLYGVPFDELAALLSAPGEPVH